MSLPVRYRWKNRHRQNLGNRCTLSIKFEVGRLYGVVFHEVTRLTGGASILAMCVRLRKFSINWLIGLVRRTSVRYCALKLTLCATYRGIE